MKKDLDKEKTTKKSVNKSRNSNKKSTKKVIHDTVSFEENNSLKYKLHFSYKTRVTIYIVLFIVNLLLCLFFASKVLEREKLNPIGYTEKGNIDYKVFLNKNNYYTEEYLDMNKAYIANLINYIDVNFNYSFSIDEKTNMDFDYKIIGELVIENSKGVNRYFEKKYTLLDTKTKSINNNNVLSFIENIKIDYNYYNQLVNSFKSEYGVNINSYLNVYLEVNSKTNEGLNYKIDDVEKINIKIPLSEKAIEISLDTDNQYVNKQVIPVGSVIFNMKYLIGEIIVFLITCIFYIKIIQYLLLLIKKDSKYDRYVKNILKSYDRLVVETKTMIDTSNCNIIKINKFTELLDVRDNLKKPIMYYNIVKHQKGIFYIKENNDIYMLTIKDIDLKK